MAKDDCLSIVVRFRMHHGASATLFLYVEHSHVEAPHQHIYPPSLSYYGTRLVQVQNVDPRRARRQHGGTNRTADHTAYLCEVGCPMSFADFLAPLGPILEKVPQTEGDT